MTKEEALKILRKDSLSNLVGYYSSEELQDAIDAIVSQPSLPSGLDEAANTFGFKETHERLREGGITRKNEGMFRWQIEKAFKAGVKWDAGQGVSMLGKVGIYGVDVESITKELREAGFNLGEEIILQIRKK